MNDSVTLPDLAGEMMLMHGCTERQMIAIEHLLGSLESYVASLHLSIVGLKALAHCGTRSIEKDAEAVTWLSNELLATLREQRGSVAGLLGKKIEERRQTH